MRHAFEATETQPTTYDRHFAKKEEASLQVNELLDRPIPVPRASADGVSGMGDKDVIVRASGQVDDEWQQNLNDKVHGRDDAPVHSRKDSWPA